MPKPAAKPAKTVKPDPLALAVDELGVLENELAPWKGKIARAEALRKLLRSVAADWNPAEAGRIAGFISYDAVLEARAFERKVNASHLYKRCTIAQFLPLVSVSLKALEALDDGGVIAQVVETSQTGTRPLHIVGKAA